MIDLITLMCRLDQFDPRIKPLDKDTTDERALFILTRRKNLVELILSILDDRNNNPIRSKAISVLDEIEKQRTILKDRNDCGIQYTYGQS